MTSVDRQLTKIINARKCLHCCSNIEGRANKQFCSGNCRKRYGEPKNNSQFSLTKRRRNMEFFDRAMRLTEHIYSLPPNERLGCIKYLVDLARSGQDNQLREILCNQYLMKANPFRDKHLFHRKSWRYLTIAQIARNYCKRFWRAKVKDVVYGNANEPDDGLVG